MRNLIFLVTLINYLLKSNLLNKYTQKLSLFINCIHAPLLMFCIRKLLGIGQRNPNTICHIKLHSKSNTSTDDNIYLSTENTEVIPLYEFYYVVYFDVYYGVRYAIIYQRSWSKITQIEDIRVRWCRLIKN